MKIFAPTTVAEALEIKGRNPDAVLAAGTTDLVPRWRSGTCVPERLLVLGGIDEMRGIVMGAGVIEIGALTSHAALETSDIVHLHLPALAEAARSIGAPAVRNMGTVGGNLANASPAADLVPPLMAYGASVRLASAAGDRDVPIEHFFVGYGAVDMLAHEMITSVVVPAPPAHAVSRFYKLGTRKAQSIAKVSMAGYAEAWTTVDTIRLAAGSVAEVPLRLARAEELIAGLKPTRARGFRAARVAAESVRPIDDVRSTAEYRRHVISVLVERFLNLVRERCA